MTLRTTAGPLTLVRRALGGPARDRWASCGALAQTARLWRDPGEIERRLDALAARGLAPARPTRLQLLFGGLDMLRFMIEPGAREYYAQQGISFGFHQLLRVLDDPVSMIDPTGFLSERDTIIGHLMQVTHLNPIYDVQLLQCFPDGLDELERQLEEMLAGTPPAPAHDRRHRRGSGLPRAPARLACAATAGIRRRCRRCASRRCAPIRTSPRPSAPSPRCRATSPTAAPPATTSASLWRRLRSLERFPARSAGAMIRVGLVLASAGLYALAFPPASLRPLAALALVPFFAAAAR